MVAGGEAYCCRGQRMYGCRRRVRAHVWLQGAHVSVKVALYMVAGSEACVVAGSARLCEGGVARGGDPRDGVCVPAAHVQLELVAIRVDLLARIPARDVSDTCG
jgi:hypothetical protein